VTESCSSNLKHKENAYALRGHSSSESLSSSTKSRSAVLNFTNTAIPVSWKKASDPNTPRHDPRNSHSINVVYGMAKNPLNAPQVFETDLKVPARLGLAISKLEASNPPVHRLMNDSATQIHTSAIITLGATEKSTMHSAAPPQDTSIIDFLTRVNDMPRPTR
jgi:hypothetical protein